MGDGLARCGNQVVGITAFASFVCEWTDERKQARSQGMVSVFLYASTACLTLPILAN
jgi:hypothetical protein